MTSLHDIEINRFQLNALLNQHEKQGFKYLLNHGIYCRFCKDICPDGVTNYKLYLDRLNDIKVTGQCSSCGTDVSRIMEFGENESFFRKAVQFRNRLAVSIEDD